MHCGVEARSRSVLQLKLLLRELNLSETAFLVPDTSDPHRYLLRWFTPEAEVELCGHATLGSTAALHALGVPADPKTSAYTFDTVHVGPLTGGVVAAAANSSNGASLGKFELDFPADPPVEIEDEAARSELARAVDAASGGKVRVTRFLRSSYDAVLEVDCGSAHLGDLDINAGPLVSLTAYTLATSSTDADRALLQSGLRYRCIALTTLLPDVDPRASSAATPLFHSRCFCPDIGIAEDPVTGSLHCCLAVLYAQKFGVGSGVELFATQGGKRRGEISVVWNEEKKRVKLRGEAVRGESESGTAAVRLANVGEP